ncbi:MAG: hypothetical protein WAO76_00405 [Georgfuchsia sp.]
MTIRIPSPIPEPERTELIMFGREACAQPDGSNAQREARQNINRITEIIALKYGQECEK